MAADRAAAGIPPLHPLLTVPHIRSKIGRMSTAPRLESAKHDWGDDINGCTVLHIDMDAFYASCETVRHPELRGKPVIIGTGRRAVVSAASYEARKFGVNSAMPAAAAHRLCPQGIFLPVDMQYYRSMSSQVFGIFARITDRIEKVSVDECYMDVSGALLQWKDPREIAAWIRQTVKRRIGVTCSVGIASNKLIAKLASTNAKPDGMLMIPQSRQAEFIQMMPIRAIPGIGPSTERALSAWGISTVKQLADMSISSLTSALRSAAHARYLYQAARGLGSSEVVVSAAEKSIGAERTFAEDTNSWLKISGLLRWCCDDVASTLRRKKIYARTVTVKLRLSDLSHISKSLTVTQPMNSAAQIYPISRQLLARLLKMQQPEKGKDAEVPRLIRLAGVSTSHFSPASSTMYQPSIDDLDEGDVTVPAGENKDACNASLGSGHDTNAAEAGKNAQSPLQQGPYQKSKNKSKNPAPNTAKIESALDRIREKFGKGSASLGI